MKKYYKIGIESKSWFKSAYEAFHKRGDSPYGESLLITIKGEGESNF